MSRRVKAGSQRWLPGALCGVVVLAILPTGAAAEPPALRFFDATAEAGIDFVHTNGASREKRLPETDGSGVAFLDADGDGRQDLYFVNSGHMDKGRQGADNRLYRSVGDGHFQAVTGAGGAPGDAYGMGVLAGDPDNDGDTDLYLTAWGEDQFFRNDSRGGFVDATGPAELGNSRWSSSAAYLDYDSDGDLDLFVTNYVRFDLATHPWCGRRDMDMRFYCDPRQYEPETDGLYRNEGDGTFTDVSVEAGINGRGNGLGVVSGDFDDDGRADVYVANDMSPNFLYRNRGDGTFSEEGMLSGTALSADGASQAGMGVDAADFDRDGDLDIVVTNYQLENNTLYLNDDPFFDEVSFNSGIGEVSLNYLGFGVGFFDWDNDGWLDLFVTNGHVHDNIERYDPIVTYPQRAQVFRNLGDRKFVDITDELGAALQKSYVGRGLAFADYDDDGDIDVAVSPSGGPALLLRNDGGNSMAWLRVRLRGTTSNRDAVGAKVWLYAGGTTQFHQVRAGTGYQSTSELTVHFGLGVATGADSLWVEWPSGTRQRFGPQTARRTLLITEP
ncbi:MAG: CRTAC1 family protein [Candidatus Latescibacterota bacterium]|nr:CRTAC1 family protein [Candidatus Latescibacterota bacterium]